MRLVRCRSCSVSLLLPIFGASAVAVKKWRLWGPSLGQRCGRGAGALWSAGLRVPFGRSCACLTTWTISCGMMRGLI